MLRFGSVRQQNRWLSRLEMRQRHPDESVAVLGDDLRRMAQRAYCDLDTIAQEVLALNQLYKIISPEMKCRCIDRDCRTVADAVDVIERYESIMGEPKGRITSSVRRVTVPAEPDQSGGIEKYLRDISASISRLEQSRQPQQPGYNRFSYDRSPRPPKRCLVCNEEGHFMRNCPLFQQMCHAFRNSQADYALSGRPQHGNIHLQHNGVRFLCLYLEMVDNLSLGIQHSRETRDCQSREPNSDG